MMTRLFTRFSLAGLILLVVALALPAPVFAATGPSLWIVSVKADESVTVRITDAPKDVDFTVRMDVAGNMAIDGIVVKEIDTGQGGTLNETYSIPAELKGKKTLAIRIESSRGYFAYNWFNNKNLTSSSSVPGGSLSISFKGIKQNDTVTVEARNLVASTEYSVRVGPYYNFSKGSVITQTFNSGKGGTAVFNIKLPESVMDVELVSVRLDGGGRFAYNAFKNVDSGSIADTETTIPVTGYACSLVSVAPSTSLSTGADFDAVWEVKNTGSKDWDISSVDYKFVSGTKMHTQGDRYDMQKTVKKGETVKIYVDMLAPATTGWYTANWALVQGNATLCSLPLNLRVK